MLNKIVKDLSIIVLFVLISTFSIWLPHMLALPNFLGLNFSNGFNTIYRNFDGLEYVIIAKTSYSPKALKLIPQSLPEEYYASHFPGYAAMIGLFAPVLGYLKSMLFVSVLLTIASAIAFYFLVKDFQLSKQPLFLTLVFLILPARWLIVRNVGSAEPMFAFFTILTFYFLLKADGERLKTSFLWFSAISASVAQFTRPPGVLITLAILIFVLWQTFLRSKHSIKKALAYFFSFYPFTLALLTLLAVFYVFHLSFNDFWAYFHSGDNIHLALPPFQVFNINQYWVGTIWLEDVIYVFILGLLAGLLLLKDRLIPLGIFILTYLVASFFVAHRDISRYILPIAPFVIIAFEKVLTSKEFKIVLAVLLLAFYLYSQNFILQNTAPIPNPFLFN